MKKQNILESTSESIYEVTFVETGEEVAQIVINKLREMEIFHRICGICFDTCSVNTGWARGFEKRIHKSYSDQIHFS